MSGEYRNISSFTRGYGASGGHFKLDYCNSHYVRGRRVKGSTTTSLSFPPDVNIKKGLDMSRIIETIHPPPRPSVLEDIPIENVQYVASYNWVDAEQPTIVVPGASIPSPLEISLNAVGFHPCRFASCVDRAQCSIHLAA
jgi:hypothetical protein